MGYGFFAEAAATPDPEDEPGDGLTSRCLFATRLFADLPNAPRVRCVKLCGESKCHRRPSCAEGGANPAEGERLERGQGRNVLREPQQRRASPATRPAFDRLERAAEFLVARSHAGPLTHQLGEGLACGRECVAGYVPKAAAVWSRRQQGDPSPEKAIAGRYPARGTNCPRSRRGATSKSFISVLHIFLLTWFADFFHCFLLVRIGCEKPEAKETTRRRGEIARICFCPSSRIGGCVML